MKMKFQFCGATVVEFAQAGKEATRPATLKKNVLQTTHTVKRVQAKVSINTQLVVVARTETQTVMQTGANQGPVTYSTAQSLESQAGVQGVCGLSRHYSQQKYARWAASADGFHSALLSKMTQNTNTHTQYSYGSSLNMRLFTSSGKYML